MVQAAPIFCDLGKPRVLIGDSLLTAWRPRRHFGQSEMLRLEWPVRTSSPLPLRRTAGSRRLIPRNQLHLAIPDQVRTAHLPQRLAQYGPVVRVVIAQKGLVQPSLLDPLRNDYFLAIPRDALQWVLQRVIHRRRRRHR